MQAQNRTQWESSTANAGETVSRKEPLTAQMPTTCGHGLLLNEGLRAGTRSYSGLTERTPRQGHPLLVGRAGWSKWEAERRAGVQSPQRQPAGCRREAGTAAGLRSSGPSTLPRPRLRTLQSSGRPEPAAASEPQPPRRTTGSGGPEPRTDSKKHRARSLVAEELQAPR